MVFILSIILLLFFPVFSVPVALIGVRQGEKRVFPVLVFAFALVSAFYMPFGDQYRYYQDFQEISSWSASIFFEDGAYRKLSISTLIMWLVNEAGGNFEHVRMVCVLLGYAIGLHVINKTLSQEDNLTRGMYFTAFLTLFLTLPFLPICQGYRQGLGACFALLSIHCWVEGAGRWKWVVYMLLAVLSHPFYLIFAIFLPISKCNITKGMFLTACFVACFGVYLIDALYNAIAPYLPGQLSQLSTYFDQEGYWRSVDDKLSSFHKIGECLNQILFVAFSAFHAYMYFSVCGEDVWGRSKSCLFAKFVLILFVGWCLTIQFSTLNYRLQYVLIMMTAFSFIRLMLTYRKLRGHMSLVFVLTCALMLYFAMGYKDLFKNLDYHALLNSSSIQLLKHTYTTDYVDDMLDFTGAFYEQ